MGAGRQGGPEGAQRRAAVSGLQLCGDGQSLEYEPGRSRGPRVAGVLWASDNETLTSLHSYGFHHHQYL